MKVARPNPWLLLVLAFLVFLTIFCERQAPPSNEAFLAELDSLAGTAETAADSVAIAERLEAYYLALTPNDSLADILFEKSRRIVRDFRKMNPKAIIQEIAELENPYKQENNLRRLLQWQIVSTVDDSLEMTPKIRSAIDSLAPVIDQRTENSYWEPWRRQIAGWDSSRCREWLTAEAARQLCRGGVLNSPKGVETWAAIGLRALQMTEDKRLEYEIKQRVFVNLYKNFFHNRLAALYANNLAKDVLAIKDHLRYVGVLFQLSESYKEIGAQAEQFLVLTKTAQYAYSIDDKAVPNVDYYAVSNLNRLGIYYTNQGQHKRALAVFDSIGRFPVIKRYKSLRDQYKMGSGLTYLAGAQYEKALETFEFVSQNAVDPVNRIAAFQNITTVYERMAIPFKALDAVKSAMALLNKHRRFDARLRLNLLTRTLILKGQMKSNEGYPLLIAAIDSCSALVEAKDVLAETAQSLGVFYMYHRKQPDIAETYFAEAEKLYLELSWTEQILRSRLNRAWALIYEDRFEDASGLLRTTIEMAVASEYKKDMIRCLALQAFLEDRRGDLSKAVEFSDRMLEEVEEFSRGFDRIDNLIFFRNWIYSSLSDAVVYELKLGRLQAAKNKLARIRQVRRRSDFEAGGKSLQFAANSHYDSDLKPGVCRLSYFTQDEQVFTFIETIKHQKILVKEIPKKQLEASIEAYLNRILGVRNYVITLRKQGTGASQMQKELGAYYSSTWREGLQLSAVVFSDSLLELIAESEQLEIFSDATLSKLPFECLPIPEQTNTYLASLLPIIHKPSALDISNLSWVMSKSEAPKILLGVDLIDFRRAKSLEASLLDAGYEVSWLYQGAGQSKNEIFSKLEDNYDLCLLLGHSLAVYENPDDSWIQIGVQSQNGLRQLRLTAEDIKSTDWSRIRTLIFLGCSTGDGPIVEGLGFAALAQAGLLGGASQVIASPWAIPNDNYIGMIEDMLLSKHLFDGQVQKALQYVQKKEIGRLSDKNQNSYPHPYYWAGLKIYQLNSI